MNWRRSPLGRWHYIAGGSVPGYRSSACGAWCPTDDEAARAYGSDARPVDACGRCVLLAGASEDEARRAREEAERWRHQRRRKAIASAVEGGTTAADVAREVGLSERQVMRELAKERDE